MGDLISEGADHTAVPTLKPSFHPSSHPEPLHVQSTLKTLRLEPHIEGGYFVQTDASPVFIPSPYPEDSLSDKSIALAAANDAGNGHTNGNGNHVKPNSAPGLRCLSTTIFYYLSPRRPLGTFHRNRSRIVHTLHRGRGVYVLIYPPKNGKPARIESFVVGQRIEEGERLQWVVEGGIWKASFLLDDDETTKGEKNPGLLISETVVPGFEYADHEFLSQAAFKGMFVEGGAARDLEWLVRKEQPTVYNGLDKDEEAMSSSEEGDLKN